MDNSEKGSLKTTIMKRKSLKEDTSVKETSKNRTTKRITLKNENCEQTKPGKMKNQAEL